MGPQLRYLVFGTLPVAAGLLAGLKLAVLAIVAAAAVRIGKRVLKNSLMVGLAVATRYDFLKGVPPFPLIVLGAAVIGYFGFRWWPKQFAALLEEGVATLETESECGAQAKDHKRFSGLFCAPKSALLGGLFWWLTVIGIGGWLGWKQTVFAQALFFSKTAVVTFLGAYAVLPFMWRRKRWKTTDGSRRD